MSEELNLEAERLDIISRIEAIIDSTALFRFTAEGKASAKLLGELRNSVAARRATVAEPVSGDSIDKSKHIMALVDDYVEKNNSASRAALRNALMDEFEREHLRFAGEAVQVRDDEPPLPEPIAIVDRRIFPEGAFSSDQMRQYARDYHAHMLRKMVVESVDTPDFLNLLEEYASACGVSFVYCDKESHEAEVKAKVAIIAHIDAWSARRAASGARECTSDMLNCGADAMREGMAMLNSGRSYQSIAKKVYEAMRATAPLEESGALDGWISVEDRLPEIGVEVQVYRPRSGSRNVTALARFIRYGGATDYYWDNAYPGTGFMNLPKAVTHWRPLAAAPLADEQEGT